MSMLRPLNHTESSWTYSNGKEPLCVVIVIKLKNVFPFGDVERALLLLQKRYQLLDAGISEKNERYYFHSLNGQKKVSLKTFERKDIESWKAIAEKYLNTIFDDSGPLMQCALIYPQDGSDGEGEILLVFHHSIIDGTSARQILHEFLDLAGGNVTRIESELTKNFKNRRLPGANFPKEFSGLNMMLKIPGFLFRQMREELDYRKNGVKLIPARSSFNKVITLVIPEANTKRFMVNLRRNGLTMNSTLNSIMLLAVNHVKQLGRNESIHRVISFADLRPFWDEDLKETDLGSFISMVPTPVHLEKGSEIISTSKNVSSQVNAIGRKNELFLYSYVGKHLVKMVHRKKTMRMATVALSYIDELRVDKKYGKSEILDVMAFITNNRFGPLFSGFAKLLFGRLEMDFTYLSSETSDEQAQEIVDYIKASILDMAT